MSTSRLWPKIGSSYSFSNGNTQAPIPSSPLAAHVKNPQGLLGTFNPAPMLRVNQWFLFRHLSTMAYHTSSNSIFLEVTKQITVAHCPPPLPLPSVFQNAQGKCHTLGSPLGIVDLNAVGFMTVLVLCPGSHWCLHHLMYKVILLKFIPFFVLSKVLCLRKPSSQSQIS